ncbi:MAG: hypothetical protein K6G26_03830, partial [Lachnospiraceae bacterium]|nr:hypothetical protein [Lachnospiraceae bacterium]
MRKVYLVSVCLLILFLFLGCSKTTESKKKSDIIETDDYIIEKYTGKDCKGINFAGTSIVDGRFMYLFYSMPDEFRFYSEEEYYEDAVDKRLAYYTYDDLKSRYILYKQVGDIPEKREYIKDDGNRPYWETYNRDRILDDKYNKYVVYEEDIYHDYHGTVNGKGYIYVYDLDNDTTSCMCIDDVCSGDIDKTELGKLAGKPQLLNDSTLAIADYNIILVYNFKESKTEYLNLNDYKDFFEESDDIFEYYYDSDILNVYCYDNASNNRNLVVYQFEMNKKQLKCKKSFDTEEFEPEFYDEYIVLSKNGTHYIVDAKTLEIIVDLAKFETDKGSVEKATYYGKIKKSIDVSIKDDNAYIVSDNGVKKVD